MTTRTITRDCNKKTFKHVPTGKENNDTTDKSVFGTEESDQHKLFFQPLRRSERLRSRVSHLFNPNNYGSTINLTNSSNQAEQLLMDVIMQSTSANAEMTEVKQENNRLLVLVRAKNDEIQRLSNILMEKVWEEERLKKENLEAKKFKEASLVCISNVQTILRKFEQETSCGGLFMFGIMTLLLTSFVLFLKV